MNSSFKKYSDDKMQQYFASLSPTVKECIIQSGASPQTLSQLQSLARNFTGAQEPGYDSHGNFQAL